MQHPEICQQIRRRLQLQLDRADQWIVELGTGSAKKRVARLLQMMTEYAGGPGGELTLPAGADIGALIGASPETVSRVMADLKRNRVLTRHENRHYHCDTAVLQAIIDDGSRS